MAELAHISRMSGGFCCTVQLPWPSRFSRLAPIFLIRVLKLHAVRRCLACCGYRDKQGPSSGPCFGVEGRSQPSIVCHCCPCCVRGGGRLRQRGCCLQEREGLPGKASRKLLSWPCVGEACRRGKVVERASCLEWRGCVVLVAIVDTLSLLRAPWRSS